MEHCLEAQEKEFSKKDYGRQKSSIWMYEGRIPSEICDYIVNEFKQKQFFQGQVGSQELVDVSVRNVLTTEVPRTHWVNGIPMYFGFDANFENFDYQVSNVAFTEFFQYNEGMFYKPHIDINPHINHPAHGRKLTVITQLSDESDYVGGELQIYNSKLKPITITKKKGSIIVFDSFATHCVKKIKSGTRYSLASWIVGSPFS